MNYQGTAYSYNQRSEILMPTRRGTTYYGAQNHKPLIAYTGVDTDIEFYVTNTDRKPVSLENKTFTARIISHADKTVRVTKTLTVLDYTVGSLLMRLTQADVSDLTAGLYDLTITYTDSEGLVVGLQSDLNSRFTYTLEIKENPGANLKESSTAESFNTVSGTSYSEAFASTAQTYNSDGTNTAAVYTTNFTGTVYAQGTLELNPGDRDWFNIKLDPEQTNDYWTFTSTTDVTPFTWDGMFQWVRFYYIADVANVGTLDKILYRA